MSKKKGGFFDDLAKIIELQGIVQASKDSNGKPDKWKAGGIAVGLGYDSWDDIMTLGAMLGSQGTFDDDDNDGNNSWRLDCEDGSEWDVDPDDFDTLEEYMEVLHDAKYGWREHCEDGTEWYIYPEDYETEDEYVESLEEAKYAWRDDAEDGSDFGLDPEDFEREEEYETALEEARVLEEEEEFSWRNTCEDGFEWGIDPDDYDTPNEYLRALNNAKYEWRTYCEDGSEWNIDPMNFETEEEYEAALEYEKDGWRSDVEDGSDFHLDPYDYNRKEEYQAALESVKARIPKKEEYPNRRKYLAAKALFELETSGYYDPSDEYDKRLHDRYEFILNNPSIIASNYLTPNGEFIFTQALKENFDLPITVKSEDEKPKSYLNEVLERIAKKNPVQACELWIWCIEIFSPYSNYEDEAGCVVDNVCAYIRDYPEMFLETLWKNLDEKPRLLRMIFDTCEDSFVVGIVLLKSALEKKDSIQAKHVLKTYMESQYLTEQHIYDLLNDVVSYCCDDTYDLVAAECFKYEIIPVISECDYRDILDTIEEWTEKLDDQIDEVERYSEKYRYTRRYSWRQNCADGSEWDVYPEEYETEEEYNAAIQEEKYAWRSWRKDGEKFGIHTENYETEEEFNAAVNTARRREREEERRKEREERERLKAEEEKNLFEEMNVAEEDDTVYTFYGVEFGSGSKIYQYLKGNEDLQIGDKVIVPVGKDNLEQEATVITIQQHRRRTAPYPIEKTKRVIRKRNESDL